MCLLGGLHWIEGSNASVVKLSVTVQRRHACGGLQKPELRRATAETDLFEPHLLSCHGSPHQESKPTLTGNVKLK